MAPVEPKLEPEALISAFAWPGDQLPEDIELCDEFCIAGCHMNWPPDFQIWDFVIVYSTNIVIIHGKWRSVLEHESKRKALAYRIIFRGQKNSQISLTEFHWINFIKIIFQILFSVVLKQMKFLESSVHKITLTLILGNLLSLMFWHSA